MEKIKVKDKNGNSVYLFDFIFNDDKGVFAIIATQGGKFQTVPLCEITFPVPKDK